MIAYNMPREVVTPDNRLPLSRAVAWVKVSAEEVAALAMHRARLAQKNVKPEILLELGVYDATSTVGLWDVLRDEAKRMKDVCETRESLVEYLLQWVELVITTPSRQQRKTHRYPLPADDAAVDAFARHLARSAAEQLWNEHEALERYFSSLEEHTGDDTDLGWPRR